MNQSLQKNNYFLLINSISSLLEQSRRQAYHAVNQILVKTYWEIGKQIVEYEQERKEKEMRRFYQSYHKWQTVSAELSWLLSISKFLKIFYNPLKTIR